MKKTLSVLVILSFTFFQSCSNSSFKQNIETNSSGIGFFEKVDSVVINKMNQYNIPGLSIGLIRNDSIIYNKGDGIRANNNNNLVTENSIFHTASISKLFTAVAIMELIAQNRITIEDKLVDLLPKLKYNDKRVSYITIKNLSAPSD